MSTNITAGVTYEHASTAPIAGAARDDKVNADLFEGPATGSAYAVVVGDVDSGAVVLHGDPEDVEDAAYRFVREALEATGGVSHRSRALQLVIEQMDRTDQAAGGPAKLGAYVAGLVEYLTRYAAENTKATPAAAAEVAEVAEEDDDTEAVAEEELVVIEGLDEDEDAVFGVDEDDDEDEEDDDA